jgi:ATP-dependent DNA helicase HFM1/MER3
VIDNCKSLIYNLYGLFSMGEELRPVKLKKIVYGYECRKGVSPFKFDLQITYRLKDVLMRHSDGKPSLV